MNHCHDSGAKLLVVDSVYILPLTAIKLFAKRLTLQFPIQIPTFSFKSFNAHIYPAISLPRIDGGVRSIDVQRSAVQCNAKKFCRNRWCGIVHVLIVGFSAALAAAPSFKSGISTPLISRHERFPKRNVKGLWAASGRNRHSGGRLRGRKA